MTEEHRKKLYKMRVTLLKFSRGEFPKRPCSPYGGLATDWPAIQTDMREFYEIIAEVMEADHAGV